MRVLVGGVEGNGLRSLQAFRSIQEAQLIELQKDIKRTLECTASSFILIFGKYIQNIFENKITMNLYFSLNICT